MVERRLVDHRHDEGCLVGIRRVARRGRARLILGARLLRGPIIGLRQGMVDPADGKWEITARKIFLISESHVGTMADAISVMNIPTMRSTPARSPGRPDTVVPNITRDSPLYCPSNSAHAPCTIVFSVIFSCRPRSRSCAVNSSLSDSCCVRNSSLPVVALVPRSMLNFVGAVDSDVDRAGQLCERDAQFAGARRGAFGRRDAGDLQAFADSPR